MTSSTTCIFCLAVTVHFGAHSITIPTVPEAHMCMGITLTVWPPQFFFRLSSSRRSFWPLICVQAFLPHGNRAILNLAKTFALHVKSWSPFSERRSASIIVEGILLGLEHEIKGVWRAKAIWRRIFRVLYWNHSSTIYARTVQSVERKPRCDRSFVNLWLYLGMTDTLAIVFEQTCSQKMLGVTYLPCFRSQP